MRKKKICSCGKIIDFNSTCECQNDRAAANKYKREYYQKNKETIKLLNSKRWRSLRKVILDRDDYHCQRCLIKYKIINGSQLQVHHIKPRVKYPELIFDENNLISLCKTCNLQLGIDEELDFEPRQVKNIQYNL